MADQACGEIIGTSTHIRAVRRFVEGASSSTDPVLLLGESGVGKELVARRVHFESPRATQPFLMIDCSLYYERELKREIFGYRGGDSVVKSRKGLLEFATEGTCYLSRVEELTPAMQVSLLEFLRNGTFRRLGDEKELSSRVRIIVSSDKNLGGFVSGGLFREELFDQLSLHRLEMAPLRDHSEDVGAIVETMAEMQTESLCRQIPQTFTSDCVEALRCFPWPKNYDELKKEIQHLLDSGSPRIRAEDLSFDISSYWMGQCDDPEVRAVVDELDSYIREFKVMARLDAAFGDLLTDLTASGNVLSRPRD